MASLHADGRSAARPGAAGALELIVTGPMTRAGIAGLCERARRLVEENDVQLVVLDLRAIADPDAVTVDAMARLHLTVRRLGKGIRFRDACREIHRLVALTGLADVLLLDPSPIEPRRKAEQREQARGVEEERDP